MTNTDTNKNTHKGTKMSPHEENKIPTNTSPWGFTNNKDTNNMTDTNDCNGTDTETHIDTHGENTHKGTKKLHCKATKTSTNTGPWGVTNKEANDCTNKGTAKSPKNIKQDDLEWPKLAKPQHATPRENQLL